MSGRPAGWNLHRAGFGRRQAGTAPASRELHRFGSSLNGQRCPSCAVPGQLPAGRGTLLLPCSPCLCLLQLLSGHCSPTGCPGWQRHRVTSFCKSWVQFSASARLPIKSILVCCGVFFSTHVPEPGTELVPVLSHCQPPLPSPGGICCPRPAPPTTPHSTFTLPSAPNTESPQMF